MDETKVPYQLQGMTLLETLLALSIGVSIILMGVNQYQHYKRQQNISQVSYLVDSLLQAMSGYYAANCSTNAAMIAPNNTVVAVDFISPGSLASNFVSSEAAFGLGHLPGIISQIFTQYNQLKGGQRQTTACSSYDFNGKCVWTTTSPATSAATLFWQAQVIVQMTDPTKTLQYANSLGADCALNFFTPGAAVSCTNAVTTGSPPYLLWQRLPSFSSPALASGVKAGRYSTILFNRQYTNDPMADLANQPVYTYSYYNNTMLTTPYYLCGG